MVDPVDKIHLCDFAQQPDIRIACTHEWTRPAWGGGRPWRSDSGHLYTFNREEVTCPDCLNRESEVQS